MSDDPLSDFTQETFDYGGTARAVFRSGAGPAVIVMAEIPGITPAVARFARRVRDLGLTAVMPDLFGVAGRDPNPDTHGWARTLAYSARTMTQVCIRREFTLLAKGRSSPVTNWLRALGAHEHRRCGGPGIGAIGMCLTGGFALAMAVDDRLVSAHRLHFVQGPRRMSSATLTGGGTRGRGARCDRSTERCHRRGFER